ncbi:MAG: hypothetical protein FRX49_05175 [Trebouxia sp. A1-2]|nr:MAG: hypothetical protein FRX49_05175 [Trebouxia sp. A1-2]
MTTKLGAVHSSLPQHAAPGQNPSALGGADLGIGELASGTSRNLAAGNRLHGLPASLASCIAGLLLASFSKSGA